MEDNKLKDVEIKENENSKTGLKENKKINSISLFVLIVGIIFMIIGIVLIITSSDNSNNNSNNNNNQNNDINDSNNSQNEDSEQENNFQDNNDEENKLKEIEITEKELKALDILPNIDHVRDIPYYSVYHSKTMNAQTVDIKVIVEKALKNLDRNLKGSCNSADWDANGLCEYTYNLDILKNKIKELYGEFNYELPAEFLGSDLLHCSLVDDHYACSNSGGDRFSFPQPYVNYFKIFHTTYPINLIKTKKAETDGTYLYIYQEYARINLKIKNFDESKSYLDNEEEKDLNNYEFRIYKYSDTDELLVDKVFIGKDYYEEDPNATPFLTKMENELEGKLTTFKHTFKITEDGSYIWVSTEEVK